MANVAVICLPGASKDIKYLQKLASLSQGKGLGDRTFVYVYKAISFKDEINVMKKNL